MDKVLQEFYCGECKGYFRIPLNPIIDYEVEICCPNCGHEHRRCVVKGVIFEQGRHQTNSREKIRVSMATYSKMPITAKMLEAHNGKQFSGRRDGVVIERDPLSQTEFDERWLSIAAREKGEI